MNCPSCRAENDEQATGCFSCGATLGPSPSSLRLGSVVAARYEILALLGRGGMGVVYKAHDRTLDETVALKLLRPEVAGRAEMAQRFRSEIKLARKVRHENVCGIHEYGQDGARRYIAMEFVDGVNLRQLVREGSGLARREAFDLSIQAAHGLQAIHDAGIIHRDLKASNIMRDSQGLVRLMDFGIAKQHGADATLHGTISGTPDYMSPEQASGQPLDYRSDIYALAVVVYELFTGKVPFKADTPVRTALKHLNEPPPLSGPQAERLPASLIPVLAKALSKRPTDRYATADGMAKALEEARTAAGFAPVLRESPHERRSEGPLALAHPGLRDVPVPTLAAAQTIEPNVTATQPGLATATELQSTEPPPTATRLERGAPQLRRGGRGRRLAWAGAALILLGGVWAWLASMRGGPPDLRRPRLSAPSVSPSVVAEAIPTEPATAPPAPMTPAPPASQRPSHPGAVGFSSGAASPSARRPVYDLASPTPEPPMSPPTAAESLPPSPPASASLPEPTQDPIPLPASAVTPVPDPGNRPPEYPEDLRAQGIEGQVYLKIVLSTAGAVEDARVLAGKPGLAEAALAAARDWRFSPAIVDGQPTRVYLVIKVPFRAGER